jgi:uncharacterized damage-inducible protein DinB
MTATDPRLDVLRAMLRDYRERLRSAWDAVPPDSRDTPAPDGGWSAARILEHIAVTDRAIAKVVGGFVTAAEPRSGGDDYDAAAFAASLNMPFFLDRSTRIRGPQPPGELRAADAWAAAEASRAELFALLDAAAGKRLEAAGTRPHPATKVEMNGYQWIAFVALHEGRHAAQMRALAAT